MYSLPDKQDEITPIWMPSPGVPIASRILSYLFAALMIIAIIRSFTIQRPIIIEITADNNGWDYYKSDLNITFPYPKNWMFQIRNHSDGTKGAVIHYPGSKPIQFQVEQNTTPDVITTEQYNNVIELLTNDKFNAKLSAIRY